MDRPEFVYVVYIACTPEAAWQGLTDPEFTSKYWGGQRIESQWTAGARVRNLRADGGIVGEGEVLIAEPPRLLSYTFRPGNGEAASEAPPSQVRFEIEQVGEMVRLQMIHHHSGEDRPSLATMKHGWPAILSSLKSLLETGHALPLEGLGG